jgi:AbrB family transcriptional regulator (stage V sporulation protein T)
MSQQDTPQKSPQAHTSNIGAKGRTVVPRAIREALHVGEGDTLLYMETPEGIQLTTRRALVERLAGSLARDDGRDLTQELLDERRAEAAREKL